MQSRAEIRHSGHTHAYYVNVYAPLPLKLEVSLLSLNLHIHRLELDKIESFLLVVAVEEDYVYGKLLCLG